MSQNNKNVFDDLYMPQEISYFKCWTDISYLVEAWRKIDTSRFETLKNIQKTILEEWEKREELHGEHEDPSVFKKHQDFLEMLVSIKYPLDQMTNPHGMVALVTPKFERLWNTNAFEKLYPLLPDTDEEMTHFRNAAVQLILIYRLYGDKLDLSNWPIPRGDSLKNLMVYEPEKGSPKRYFTLRYDNEIYSSSSWSVKMACDGELPQLTQKDIEKILINPFDPNHISSVIDTSNFMFNGSCFVYAEEVTYWHQMAEFQGSLTNRNILRRKNDLIGFQDGIRDVMGTNDLEIGIILTPFESESKRARWQPFLNSLRFDEEVDPSSLKEDDLYKEALKKSKIINSLNGKSTFKKMKKNGLNSLMVIPLIFQEEVIGLLEFGSPRPHAFDFYVVPKLNKIGGLVSTAINHVLESEHERMMAIIKQTCTAIHPSVEWRFQEMARNYLKQIENDENPSPEPVVFKNVVPLFGVSDIRGSSTKRNESIQADLTHQLKLAWDVLNMAAISHPRPVFNELSFRIESHLKTISKGLKSGDETRIYMFLKHSVEQAFEELSLLSDEIKIKVEIYKKKLNSEVGVVYEVRKNYDESVTIINDTIGAYFDRQQELAQKMIPHYFEKFKTDGLEHNIYVGDSLLESGVCSALDLRNLYLWQLMSMCGVTWLMKELKPTLKTPLDTAHLLLVHTTPINISFQMEEKHFNVDGAYNARYEIVKKRIDKASIHGTEERLTQPGYIAVVYSQESEYQMYREFITYLESLEFIEGGAQDVLLEDLQGVHGLRAIRIKVKENPPKGWDPKKPETSLATLKESK